MSAIVYAPERHREIVSRARERGRIEVRNLAESLSVTPETIRRDLTELERLGMLRRVHGGAIPVEHRLVGQAGTDGEAAPGAQEQRIAKAALAELPDGGSVILGADAATSRLAELLPTDTAPTVVTRSVPVAALVASLPNVSLHVLGGLVRGRTPATGGEWTIGAAGGVFVDAAFMGADAITPDHGLSTSDADEARITRALIGAAARTVVLADHSRFGRAEPVHVAPIDAVDLVISDSGLDSGTAGEVATAGPRIELA
ncbi:DeoR family fructose operon transcriptional repressor [Spinactinospora alkalitolerans]|uniref:Lactose phosphotransferase system repressor n=1 Tax=Spinactinospora alkalitolerans TaxID=687207 RepID=A0A852TYA6_9ACTN|nr:DeoR/GlpR family DNA-binding transcription regulator [Spinactinospora alkalitolerans]NYE49526.1 DeoR family fructose operon transcriptional repressor [Spinactinospora alkalitolerans]